MGVANNRIDMTNLRCGRLIVIEPYEHKNRQIAWLCRCDCGEQVVVRGAQLRNGKTKSCGCLRRERYNWAGYGEMGNQYWYAIQQHAKARNRKITITIKYIWELFLK